MARTPSRAVEPLDDLQVERKYVTHLWYQCVNLSLFAMRVMDMYLL